MVITYGWLFLWDFTSHKWGQKYSELLKYFSGPKLYKDNQRYMESEMAEPCCFLSSWATITYYNFPNTVPKWRDTHSPSPPTWSAQSSVLGGGNDPLVWICFHIRAMLGRIGISDPVSPRSEKTPCPTPLTMNHLAVEFCHTWSTPTGEHIFMIYPLVD